MPESAETWHSKGADLRRQGDRAAAVTAFNQALKQKPDFAEACLNLAQTLEELGKADLAIKAYEHWLRILEIVNAKNPPAAATPETAIAWAKKGNDLLDANDMEGAVAAYDRALAIAPDFAAALANKGVALYHRRRLPEAIETLLAALRVKSGFADALNALGSCYKEQGRLAQALAVYRRVVAFQPKHLFGWLNIGRTTMDMRLYADSIAAYERVLALDANHAEALAEGTRVLHHACQWDKSEPIRKRLEEIVQKGVAAEPFTVMSYVPDMQCENAKRWAKQYYPQGKGYDASRPLPADTRGDGKLRIGYLSSDLQRHATAALITELFELHDRDRFSIYAYSHGRDDGGEERKRIVQAVDVFRDIIAVNNAAADALIREDGIDILVDLKGYTLDHRLEVMAARPAPMQMHYLGYPGSTGAAFIDYYIGDATALPENFSEAVIRLPHSYQINDRKRPFPEAAPRADYGLPEEAFVFCAFNNVNKIAPGIFDIWMRIVKAVPSSVLWLYATHPLAIANLRREAEKRGVDANRLVFANAAKMADHLARYRHADLVLDTQPYCGHTTTSDALWCGVPVVATTGKSFVSRVAAGLLQAVGLPELVAENLEAYEALALELARDDKRRLAIKEHLEKGRLAFPAFDSVATTHAIENAYLEAAQRHRNASKPAAFNVSA